ncbi:MAG: tRNA lysidine(34) synthetase TilS [bacterium]
MPRKLVKSQQTLNPLAAEVLRKLALIGKRKLILAVSGGADSVALLHLLLEAGLKNLVVAHFNHHLRGTHSRADAAFVKRLAKRHSLPFELGSADVRKLSKEKQLSIETAAREARYTFLVSVAKHHRTRYLILAHHADDQVETCLFNFIRGSGAAGLAGMKPHSERSIDGITLKLQRPLLDIRKQQLLTYLAERNLKHREDETNAIADTSRNKIRLKLLPLIEKLFGSSFQTAIIRSAHILAEEDEFLSGIALSIAMRSELSVKLLQGLHPAIRRRVLHLWLKRQGVEEGGFAEVKRLASLLEFNDQGIGTAKINLPGNQHARRKAGVIFIETS